MKAQINKKYERKFMKAVDKSIQSSICHLKYLYKMLVKTGDDLC